MRQGCGHRESMGIEKNNERLRLGTQVWMVYWKGPNIGLSEPQSLTRPCANSRHTTFHQHHLETLWTDLHLISGVQLFLIFMA